jgi:hypothetical protein
MAGIFYSLQEVTQKLHKSEDEIKEMVKAGKLREFRDGPNLLFKVDEVDALIKQGAEADFEQLILADTGVPATGQKGGKTPSKPEEKTDESIFLTEDTAGSKADLINADTALISEGLGLAETGGGAEKLDDIMEATKTGSGKPSVKGEGDLNLDSFGSGGLLDLSLQADDTSLGGILDEIYTPETAEATPAAKAAPSMEEAIRTDEMLEAPKQVMEAAAVMPVAVEIKPDTFSNALGISLFIPLLATIFTIIIASTGFSLPSILQAKSSMFGIYMGWIIMAGLVVIALLIIGSGALIGGLGTKGEAKPKDKKEKPPKPPKEKKSKKK